MADDVAKTLGQLKANAAQLKHAEARLTRSIEQIDAQLTRLGIGVRVPPEPVSKGGPQLGCRRFFDGWRLTTVITGLAELQAETPVHEAAPEIQRELVAHVPALLTKLSTAVGARLKATQKAAGEAEKLLEAVAEV